jgi:GGDEF domain-containing protein
VGDGHTGHENAGRAEAREFFVTLSAGIAAAPTRSPVRERLREADLALYRAKQESRNRIAIDA